MSNRRLSRDPWTSTIPAGLLWCLLIESRDVLNRSGDGLAVRGAPRSCWGRAPKPEQLQLVAGADHQPLPVHLFQSPQQELPEAPSLFGLSEHRLHCLHPQRVTLPPPFRPQLPPHPVPSRQMARYAAPGRGRDCRSVASPTRSDEGVHPQGIEVIDCLSRVVARVGGDFPGHGPGVEHGLLIIPTA